MERLHIRGFDAIAYAFYTILYLIQQASANPSPIGMNYVLYWLVIVVKLLGYVAIFVAAIVGIRAIMKNSRKGNYDK